MNRNSHLLSDDELKALGVSKVMSDDKLKVYETTCAVCGRKTNVYNYSPLRAYKCAICQGELAEKNKKKRRIAKNNHEKAMSEDLGVDYLHYQRFEKGVRKFGIEYLYAINQAETVIEKFDSVPEVVACIELLHIGARVIPHKKIGNYTVDFCLPDEKLIIEIDGTLYHSNVCKEHRRDIALMHMLGDGWKVKHIPADDVMKNHEFFGKNMKILLDDRRFELRSK